MPIRIGTNPNNQAEINHGSNKMQKVYFGAVLVWQKITSLGLGLLYNRATVDDSRELAPTGWRVASLEDYTELAGYLGGLAATGGELKAIDPKWTDPNTGAEDSVGFKALPAGQRDDTGLFSGLGLKAIFWIK